MRGAGGWHGHAFFQTGANCNYDNYFFKRKTPKWDVHQIVELKTAFSKKRSKITWNIPVRPPASRKRKGRGYYVGLIDANAPFSLQQLDSPLWKSLRSPHNQKHINLKYVCNPTKFLQPILTYSLKFEKKSFVSTVIAKC